MFLNDTTHLEINNDQQLLKEYGNKVRSLMIMVEVLKGVEQQELVQDKNLLALLSKEYHLR